MKKFFSLLCATLLVFSASAAPQAKKAEIAKKAPVAVEQVQKVQFEKVQTATLQSDGIQLEPMQTSNENQLSTTPALKVTNQEAADKAFALNEKTQASAVRGSKSLKSSIKANYAQPVAHKVPAAVTEATKVVGENLYQESDYIQIYADGYYYIFMGNDEFVLDQTYTIEDLYVAEVMDESYNEDIATAATIKLTEKENLLHIDATMTTESGAEYEITYDEPQPETVDITATLLKAQSSGTQYLYNLIDEAGNNFQFYFYLAAAFELGKTYTEADLIDRFGSDYIMSYVIPAGSRYYYTYSKVSFTMTEDESNLKHIVASVKVPELATIFNIKYDEVAFVPTGVQIDVVANNYAANYKYSWEEYEYTASNDDYSKIYLLVYTDEEFGTFNEEVDVDFCTLTKAEGGSVSFHSVATPIVVAKDEDGNKSLKGSLYATNGDEYIFNLVYEKPKVESVTALVEDAKLTKTSQFFHVDGNDTKGAYGITLYVVTKNLEGEFTVEDLDTYNSGVSDLSAKKWFDIDSCNIVSEKLGSNTLVISGILHTSNAQLGRLIDMTFVLTARIDANGELMDIYGGIVSPAKGDTLSFTRSGNGTAFFKNPSTGGLAFGAQSGKTTMIAVDDSAYYWYNPISKLTTGYWIKGIKDKQANAIVFDIDQVINVYNNGSLLGQMKWLKATTAGKFSLDAEYSNVVALDIKGAENDSLVMRGSAPFDFTQDIHFPGVYVDGYGFQSYGDAGTILTLNKPITERDTVKVTADMKINAEPANGIIRVSAETEAYTYILEVVGADTVGTFSLADGTLSQKVYYGIVAKDGSVRSDFAEGSVTIAKNETGLKLDGLMIGVDEKAYVFNWTYTPITERDTVKVNLEAITVQEDVNSTTGAHRGWLYVGVGTEAQYIVQVLGNEQLGTFSYAAGTLGQNYYNIVPLDGSSRQQFTEGEVTIVEDEEGVKLTGLLIGEDEKAYALNWIQPAGRLQYDTDAPFKAKFAWSDMNATIEDGVIGIYATNAKNQTIGLELYTDPANTTIPEGTYVISDTYEAGTALKSVGIVGRSLTECWAGVRAASGGISDCWFMVEGTITLSYDEYGKLKVVVDAKNSYGQPVTAVIAYEKLEPKTTVEFKDAELFVYDGYVESGGIMKFYGGNADGYKFDLYVYADTVAGDFLDVIDFGNCKLTSPMGSIGILDAYEFKVEADGKNLTMTAKVLGADTVQYNISATGYRGAIPMDSKVEFSCTFENTEATYDKKLSPKYLILTATNEAGDEVSIKISGTSTWTSKTYENIVASTGLDENDDPTPSYIEDANGNLWFIQSGTLNFNATDKSATFEGLNSYDKAVKFKILPPPSATLIEESTTLDNTLAEIVPGDHDGNPQLFINEDGALQWNENQPGENSATWAVKFFKTGEFTVTINQANGSGHNFKVTLATAEGTELNAVEEGADSWTKGDILLDGKLSVATAGDTEYKLILTNNTEWSAADAQTITVKYKGTETNIKNTNANVKAAKRINHGQIVIVRENKEYNILGAAL